MEAALSDFGHGVSLLSGSWDSQLAELLEATEESLILASPFITRRVTGWVGDCLSKRSSAKRLQIVCLTNIRIDSILAGSLELEGIVALGRAFPGFCTVHLPSLHAKVFVSDSSQAIITSGNLTEGGLRRNCEYGVSLRSPGLVTEIRRDFEDYARLGAPVTLDEVGLFATDLQGLRKSYQKQNRQLISKVRGKFEAKLKAAEDRVLQFRARSETNQGIFRRTILYLLGKSALTTAELHPLIQQIHSDLCDDTIDRVIGGLNFGKKWKHHVRSAQQALKREGRVLFDGKRWMLARL